MHLNAGAFRPVFECASFFQTFMYIYIFHPYLALEDYPQYELGHFMNFEPVS